MTYHSPRIYIYKITFEEVLYYYYGVHKEKVFGEEYWGSPYTHKWCWELYTPKKQILQFFDFTDEGWLEANLVEDRLIRPFFNTDKWCLNESCGGVSSLETKRKVIEIQRKNKTGLFGISKEKRIETGIKSGNKAKELGIGVHSLTKEELSEAGKMGGSIGGKISGQKNKENKIGIFSWTKEQFSENGKIAGKISYNSGNHYIGSMCKEERSNHSKKIYENGLGIAGISKEERISIGNKTYENKVGIHGLTEEQRIENGKKGGNKAKELGIGIHNLTPEQRTEIGKKSAKVMNSQRWMCLETEFVTTAGALTRYQRKRGIDTSKRKRIA